jgi:ATP-dependent DNA ligase
MHYHACARAPALSTAKRLLATAMGLLLTRAASGLRFNDYLDNDDGLLVFAHACKLGLEGIVSKQRNSHYRSGRSPDWIKSTNPDAAAVKRETEEEWGRWPTTRAKPRSS